MEIYQCNDWIKSVKETEQEFTPHQEETRLCVCTCQMDDIHKL